MRSGSRRLLLLPLAVSSSSLSLSAIVSLQEGRGKDDGGGTAPLPLLACSILYRGFWCWGLLWWLRRSPMLLLLSLFSILLLLGIMLVAGICIQKFLFFKSDFFYGALAAASSGEGFR